jgi:RNA-directed DNA polymerase
MSFDDTKNPPGGVPIERVVQVLAPDVNLLERIMSRGNMSEAWKRVKANQGQPGVDGITIDEFPEVTRSQWSKIRQTILDGSYEPQPVRRVEIPKGNGESRPLGIPTVQDRLIQQAISRQMSPLFESGFSEYSYGFRPKRSAHQAVYQLREYIESGYQIAVDVDLRKFFDTVNHDVLMYHVSKRVKDKRVLALIGKYLRAGVMNKGRLEKTRQGVPQGGPLSPLLANILLDVLDKELEKRGHKFVRYADDFIILVKSERSGERVLASIQRFLEKQLKLQLNQDKSQVIHSGQSEYLGFGFRFTSKGVRIKWSDKALGQFKRGLKRLTSRSWFISMEARLNKLSSYMRGWMNYFGISQMYKEIPLLDHWLRRRVRMCYWKQWPKRRTRIRELLRLGTPRTYAFSVGLSRKGPWRLSKVLGERCGMTNQWLKEQGLLSIKEMWVNIHYPATAR